MDSPLFAELEIQKKKLQRVATLRWFHWLIFITSILLSAAVGFYLEDKNNSKIRQDFEIKAARTTDLLVERMEKYEDALRAGVATIKALNFKLSQERWRKFSNTLNIDQRYPGINGIGVIKQVSPDKLSKFVAKKRINNPEFKVYPKHSLPDHWPITYIEPLASNLSALGLDIAHESNRYNAAVLAKSSGQPNITAPIELVQDHEKSPGFLFYMPFYREPHSTQKLNQEALFQGHVYAPFIVKNLMHGVLKQANRQVSIRVSDQHQTLYDELIESNLNFTPSPIHQRLIHLKLYGRTWDFQIATNRSFEQAHSPNKTWIIFVAFIFVYSILFLLFLGRTNQKALDFANSTDDFHQFKNYYLSSVVENVNEGLVTIDEVGTIQTVNKACEEIFGYRKEELVGENVKMLMPKDISVQHDHFLQKYKETGKKSIIGIGRELVAKTKKGDLFPMGLSISEINLNGRVFFSGIIRDLSQTKNYENEMLKVLQFQKLITESIPDLLFVKDKDFKIVYANKAFLALYPESVRDKVIGFTTFEDFSEDESKTFLKYDKIAFANGLSEKEEMVRFPDGVVRTLDTKKTRFYDPNGDVFILGLARDITELKKSEDKILNSNKQLDDFAYIASHDLKEPLRGIYNHASFLLEDYEATMDNDGKHKIDRIVFLAKRMEALISDLLYYSRLGRVELGIVDTDLNVVIDDIYDMLSDDLSVRIIYSKKLPIIHCDKIRISEAFRNLIVNGIKYNDSAEKIIEVGVHSDRILGSEHEYVFFVKDNGIGIPEKFHGEIFRIFKRLHHVDAYGGGTGSGLTFVQKIIEAHGGKVWLESKEGKGSTFYFSIVYST